MMKFKCARCRREKEIDFQDGILFRVRCHWCRTNADVLITREEGRSWPMLLRVDKLFIVQTTQYEGCEDRKDVWQIDATRISPLPPNTQPSDYDRIISLSPDLFETEAPGGFDILSIFPEENEDEQEA